VDIIIRDVEEKDGQYKIYNKDGTGGHWYITKESAEQLSGQIEPQVIRNFAALRDLVNNINESIQESEGLSFTPAVTLKTDGYEFYIEFMDNVMWDSDNNGWLPITEIELQVREGMRDILRSLSKISV
jgi:hypothetical protein